jgi:hypothetical protein
MKRENSRAGFEHESKRKKPKSELEIMVGTTV